MIVMKKFLSGLCLAALSIAAQGQTVVSIVSETCNVANTACAMTGDGGQLMLFNPQSGALTVDGVPYTGKLTSSVPVSTTNNRRVSEIAFTFNPSAVLEGSYIAARSGSGRGGYQWHHHWVFDTLTIY